MKNNRDVLILSLFIAVTTIPAFLAQAAADEPELRLKPCTIELVDGRMVEGQLAVQFDMPDHVIVYSPRLATVRSFLKDHVHALSVDGEREQLNAKRELTDTDKKLLGQVAWPDEPPAEGRKPAYTTETWDKPPRLMVWANPGRSGRVKDPSNWLVNGDLMKRWPRAVGEFFGTNYFNPGTTDMLFPAAEKTYLVRARDRYHLRHITTECGAKIDLPINTTVGNMWVSPQGHYNAGGGASFGGDKDTFFINGRPYTGDPPTTPERFSELMASATSFARKWVVRKSDPNASITLIGIIGSWDETHFIRGISILEENSIVAIGPRCLQSIRRDATLKMMSGSIIGKRANQLHKQDMMVVGTLMAGTPERPLERDCHIGISFKDHAAVFAGNMWREVGRRCGFRGFEVMPGGAIRVHSAAPSKHKLVFRCHYGDGAGDSGRLPSKEKEPEKWKIYEQLPRRISIVIWKGADVQFNGVQLRDIEANGLKLEDMSIRNSWTHVSYGPNNAGPPERLYVQHTPSMEGRGNYSYNIEAAAKGSDHTVTAGGTIANRYFRILPSGGTFAAGDEVAVRLDWLGEPEGKVRYSLDGSKTGENKGKVYAGPIKLTRTTTVRAGCIQNPAPHFRRQWREYRDTFTFVDKTRPADDPDQVEPGVVLEVYKDSEALDKCPDKRDKPGKPSATKVLDGLDLPDAGYKGATGFVYTGYIEIKKGGVYRFETETGGKSRLFIGDHLVVNNHRRYRDDYSPEKREDLKPDLRSCGSLGLAPGKHAFRLEYFHRAWDKSPTKVFRVRYQGPGVSKQPIPVNVLYRQRRWNAVISPNGGLHEGGKAVEVRMDVESRSETRGVRVRYTLDGSEPAAESPVYAKPVTVKTDTTVRAHCFREGKLLPGEPATATFLFLSGLDDAREGLVYRVYEGGWSELPDFKKLQPVETGTVKRIGIDVTDRGSNFGLVFSGYLAAPASGEYTFYTSSDDGSALSIDGQKVVDNDGSHGMQERHGKVTLSKGPHLVRVEYFQGGGGKGLSIQWEGPAIEKAAIPADVLKH
jgi:hypothetical protein